MLLRLWVLLGTAFAPIFCTAQVQTAQAQEVPQSPPVQKPNPSEPIITDEEFDTETKPLDPAQQSMESIQEWETQQDRIEAKQQKAQQQKDAQLPVIRALQDNDANETLADVPVLDPEIDAPLKQIDTFDAEPPTTPVVDEEEKSKVVRYSFSVGGLDTHKSGKDALDEEGRDHVLLRFKDLSELDDGAGKADNGAMVSARIRADEQLLISLLSSEGFFDATVKSQVDLPSQPEGKLNVILNVIPGPRYNLGVILFEAQRTEPADLITKNFVPKTGEPIIADRILSAEANIALALPQSGYPFTKVGQRDILLDPETQTGDYTLPVDIGARSSFGKIITEGQTAFDADHIELLRRFRTGELYDARKLDDLRAALVATGLLSTVSVEPIASGQTAPDGTQYANLLVTQEAGPARTLAGNIGYGTGQGFRLEGSWTHRNLFPPEGALSFNALAGTQEQGASVSFRRSNAGRRDRTAELSFNLLHSNFDAFEAFSGRLAGRISRDSTPIWQKRWTYAYGFELVGTNEKDYNFATGQRERQTYALAALPAQIGYDTSNSLLDPTKGFRIYAKLSPEASLGSGQQIYARAVLEGTVYQSISDNFVLAGRARVGSISGIERGNVVPSRRFYGGGGGSVRGFGYQQLGPRDPNNDPIGGRSLNEAAFEARYRFGNYGITGFIDAGQVYESSIPKLNNWRFGVGIGGRFYTNFGPFRLDIATPIGRRTGESKINVYVSIGQAF